VSSFEYVAVNATHTDRYRHFVNFYGGERQSHCDVFQIDGTIPEESYPSEVGVGFQPEALLVSAVWPGAGTAASNYMWIGGAARGKQFGILLYHPYLTSTQRRCWFSDREILPLVGEFSSFDPDGFTLNVPNPPGYTFDISNPLGFDLPILYLALAGAGGYDCGVAVSPGATGTQAITGLGFKPAAVMFFSSQLAAAETFTTEFSRVMVGAADANAGYSVWDGSRSSDIYTNQLARPHAITIAEDANIFTPYHPVIQAEADLLSLDSDGFTLDWTTVYALAPPYFGWMAFQNAEVGRWVYNHHSGNIGSVVTAYKPHGLAFFSNDLAHEQTTEYTPATNGSCIGIGYCDSAFDQGDLGYADVDAPPFRHPQTAGNRDTNTAFGNFGRQSGALVHDFLHDRGQIFELNGFEFNPIIGMNTRNPGNRRGSRGRMLHTRGPG
jgi:hypothetical protein